MRFSSGICDAGQLGQKALFRVDANHVDTEVRGEDLHDLIALVQAQQAMVDEHTDQLVTKRFVQQGSDNR